MACLERGRCCGGSGAQGSILYSLIKREAQPPQPPPPPAPRPAPGCSCGAQRRLALKSPQAAGKAASAVLVKTLRFVKSVPAFQQLPLAEQLALVRSGWAALLVLGLAQERVQLETVETSELSMLHTILTDARRRHDGQQQQQQQQQQRRRQQHQHQHQPPLQGPRGTPGGDGEPAGGGGPAKLPAAAEIQSIKGFLAKCWSLDISTKEYAYLKGTVLFNPELPGLHCAEYIQGLHQEAQQALNEHVRLMHRGGQDRFARLNEALSMLGSIHARVVAELFFRPIIGTVNMDDMLLEMLCAKL